MTTEPFVVKWPNHYEPSNCPIHVRNELDMAAPQDQVWAWLIRGRFGQRGISIPRT